MPKNLKRLGRKCAKCSIVIRDNNKSGLCKVCLQHGNPVFMDLTKPETSYLIGFVQADGSLLQNTGNKGKLEIQIHIKDIDILHKIQKLLPVKATMSERIRKTNFSDYFHGATLTVCDLSFRIFLNTHGVPYGVKHKIIAPQPWVIAPDYIRGLVDGDGSIGYSKDGIPFISLCTASEDIKNFIVSFLQEHLGVKKKLNRNKRDNVYNIMITRASAVRLASILYYDGCFAMDRKYNKAKSLKWNKPYKDIHEVMENQKDLVEIVTELTPVANLKG